MMASMRRFPPTTCMHPHTSQLKKAMPCFLMPCFLRRTGIFLLCVTAWVAASSQPALGQVLPPHANPPSAASSGTDPLGRSTPPGTVLGFLLAAQSGDYGIAAQYLQMSAARRQSEGEQIATKLKV